MLSVEELNDKLIDLAFAEDIGDGDHTTLCCIPADAVSESKLLIKEFTARLIPDTTTMVTGTRKNMLR